MFYILSLFIAQTAFAMPSSPTPFPVFLKAGFSCILEFEEAPTQVVLGDPNVFQVEKLERSIVIKPLATYATTNMFVNFKNKPTRLFLLTASEEAEPTYYKSFTSIIIPEAKKTVEQKIAAPVKRGSKIVKSSFDKKKDYLTVDFEMSADAKSKIIPNWDEIRLRYKDRFYSASKLWSERREVQKDTRVRARAIFTKPNVPGDRKGVTLIVPLKDSSKSVTLYLGQAQ